jgi:hypothetical protein
MPPIAILSPIAQSHTSATVIDDDPMIASAVSLVSVWFLDVPKKS